MLRSSDPRLRFHRCSLPSLCKTLLDSGAHFVSQELCYLRTNDTTAAMWKLTPIERRDKQRLRIHWEHKTHKTMIISIWSGTSSKSLANVWITPSSTRWELHWEALLWHTFQLFVSSVHNLHLLLSFSLCFCLCDLRFEKMLLSFCYIALLFSFSFLSHCKLSRNYATLGPMIRQPPCES